MRNEIVYCCSAKPMLRVDYCPRSHRRAVQCHLLPRTPTATVSVLPEDCAELTVVALPAGAAPRELSSALEFLVVIAAAPSRAWDGCERVSPAAGERSASLRSEVGPGTNHFGDDAS